MSGRVPWDQVLAWFYQSSASDMGERSNAGSVLARLEGSSGGATTDSTWPSFDFASVARIRRVERDLADLSPPDRRTLQVHYLSARLPAKAEARMGRLCNVALWMARADGAAGKLIEALQSGTAKVLTEYRDRAELAVQAAHEAYWAVRDSR